MHCGLFSGRAVEAFPEQVGVAVVARVLLDHVREHPAQREAAAPPEPPRPNPGLPHGQRVPRFKQGLEVGQDPRPAFADARKHGAALPGRPLAVR